MQQDERNYREKLYKFFCELGKEAVLDHLIEESALLIVSAMKHLRCLRHTNLFSADMEVTAANALDDAVSVSLALDIFIESYSCDISRTLKKVSQKKSSILIIY